MRGGVSAPILLLCLKFALNCELASDSPQSFESDTVPIWPPNSEPTASESAAAHPTPNGALEVNPLPVGFGKYGGNLELSLAPHQALIASLAYFDAGNYFSGPQAELGYRVYFYRRTLSGPFVGLGVMAAPFQYHPDPDSSCNGGLGSCPQEESTFLSRLAVARRRRGRRAATRRSAQIRTLSKRLHGYRRIRARFWHSPARARHGWCRVLKES
jgi:hypothetical protein